MALKKKISKKSNARLITLAGQGEVIVFVASKEKEVMKVYFGPDCGRDIEDYDRTEKLVQPGIVVITSRLVQD